MKLLSIFSLVIFGAQASFYLQEKVAEDQLYDFLIAKDNQEAIKRLGSLPADSLSRKNEEFVILYCTHFYLLQEALPDLQQHDYNLYYLANKLLQDLEPYVEKINFSHMLEKSCIFEKQYQRSQQKKSLNAN